MLVSIGRPRRDSVDLVDHLLDCHVRIRTFTGLARTLAATAAAPAGEVADTAARVRRYFVEALPLHVADEEQTIEPLLTGTSPELDRALATMHAEHGEHAPELARLVEICATLEREPARHAELAAELGAIAASLEAQFTRHLELEERDIFPALRRLPAEDQAAIVRAMQARRATR